MRIKKFFENIKEEPKVGDYVIVDEESNNKEFKEFLATHIGQIIEIDTSRGLDEFNCEFEFDKSYDVDGYFTIFKYGTLRHFENSGVRVFYNHEIVRWDSNRENLEIYITANKYNL